MMERGILLGALLAVPAFANLSGNWKGKAGDCDVSFAVEQSATAITVGPRTVTCADGTTQTFAERTMQIRGLGAFYEGVNIGAATDSILKVSTLSTKLPPFSMVLMLRGENADTADFSESGDATGYAGEVRR